jgi:hypothetical protein
MLPPLDDEAIKIRGWLSSRTVVWRHSALFFCGNDGHFTIRNRCRVFLSKDLDFGLAVNSFHVIFATDDDKETYKVQQEAVRLRWKVCA